MTWLGFLLARLMRHEAPLAALSVPQAALLESLAGKGLALVGNARSLAGAGAAIEAADLVIRINRAPIPATESHGRRTDLLALATSLTPQDMTRIAPGRVLWMSPKRKRLPWAVAHSPGFYLHPLPDIARLADTLGAPPTTGLMMVDLLARSQAADIGLYGFDFFASLSLSGRRTAAQVPHDFAAERRFVETLVARDPRFRLWLS